MGIASANNVDFMIKGVFKFKAFGQELWVCLLYTSRCV